METTIENVACAACGIICEDVVISIRDGAIVEAQGACNLCAEQLRGQTAGRSDPPQIAEAVEFLSQSRAPLIYGLGGSTVEAQRAAVALAEAIGGTIDLALPDFHRASLQAMQTVGVSTCTLGEVRQRADVTVFWGANPTITHPTLLERFIHPKSPFLEGSRHIISVGSQEPEHPIDEFIQMDSAENLVALATLRAAVTNTKLSPAGPLSEQLSRLAERLQNAAYSVIFFGPDMDGTAEIESLFRLVRLLNVRSRCATIGLGGIPCENVLTWQTGYPCSVNFALGYPRYDPQRYSANSLLERGEVDSVVFVGAEGISELTPSARAYLADLPVVHLRFPDSRLPFEPTIQIIIARPGVHCGGTVFRMDGVPIKLRAVFDSPMPTTEAILSTIQQGVCASCV